MERIILPASDDELLKLCHIDTYRSSGAGGQHVNTTDSAVRLTLKDYGIVVSCQQERSQYLNKMLCIAKLREKVAKLNYQAPPRKATRLPKAKKKEGLEKKRKHSDKKKLRSRLAAHDIE